MAVNTDADAVKYVGVDAHELGGALPVTGAIPGLTKGTASIELASGAEKAAATRQGQMWKREAARRRQVRA